MPLPIIIPAAAALAGLWGLGASGLGVARLKKARKLDRESGAVLDKANAALAECRREGSSALAEYGRVQLIAWAEGLGRLERLRRSLKAGGPPEGGEALRALPGDYSSGLPMFQAASMDAAPSAVMGLALGLMSSRRDGPGAPPPPPGAPRPYGSA